MTTLRKSALLVLATGALAIGTLAPAAYAQSAPGGWEEVAGGKARAHRPSENGERTARPHIGGGLLAMLFGAPDADAVEAATARLTERLELTEEQTAALDGLSSAAALAREDIAEARAAIAPLEGDMTAEDITGRYAGMVAMTTARAEALEAIQPALVTFVESLNEDQVSRLASQGHRR